jgi:hypothetical protein
MDRVAWPSSATLDCHSLLKELSPQALIDALPAVWAYVENYPFPFVLVGAFAMVNGLFFYLLRAPTALGRPIMDQLAGLRLYLQTAESDRLKNAPEITAERFEVCSPMPSRSTLRSLGPMPLRQRCGARILTMRTR